MATKDRNNRLTRQLGPADTIPYDLLLLADETVEAIDSYVHASEIYVLEQENAMIAVYVLHALNTQEVEIKNIAVGQAYQGQGIGTFLLEDATRKAKQRGYKSILIGTADVATKQIYLYQKAGFEIFDVKQDFFTTNYPEPIFENGLQLKDMLMLRKKV